MSTKKCIVVKNQTCVSGVPEADDDDEEEEDEDEEEDDDLLRRTGNFVASSDSLPSGVLRVRKLKNLH